MSLDLRKLAADLREARRFVRSDPRAAVLGADACLRTVAIASARLEPDYRWLFHRLARLSANISVGMKFVRSMPGLLEAYLGAAADECDILAGPVEIPEIVLEVAS